LAVMEKSFLRKPLIRLRKTAEKIRSFLCGIVATRLLKGCAGVCPQSCPQKSAR
jgi:hypothetical protein